MIKQTTKLWFLIVSLCVVAIGTLGITGVGASGHESTGNASMEYARDLYGVITAIEPGIDGMQVTLQDNDGTEYSVTISGIQAQVFGRFEQIQEQAKIAVSGPVIAGMEPPLIVAERVEILGSEPDYVLNLYGTVTAIEPGKDGIMATVETADGDSYTVTISFATTEIVYILAEEEIRVGSTVQVSGELFDLGGAHIAADVAVVNPIVETSTDTVEVQPSLLPD